MTENMKIQERSFCWHLELESDEELGEEDCQKSNNSFLDLDSGIKSGGSKVLNSLDNCHYAPKLAGRK